MPAVIGIDRGAVVARRLPSAGIAATDAAHYPAYAPECRAVPCADLLGLRLEVANHRQERGVTAGMSEGEMLMKIGRVPF
jgi:hypothetical protein